MTEETNSRTGFYASFPRVYEAEQGKYVEYADYALLKAEVENSKRINTELLALSNRQASDIRRLAKAGDNVANFLGPCYAVREWNKAKESNPKHFDSVIDMLVHNCNEYANKIDELESEIERLKAEPDALTVYLYAAELAKGDMKKLKNENAFLKMEVERLKNNIAYLDTKLDEELDNK